MLQWICVLAESVDQRCSVKQVFLEISKKITGKYMCQSLFFDKVADLRLTTLLRKSLWNRCFPVNFSKFLRTPFLTECLRWLLLFYLDVLEKSIICELTSHNPFYREKIWKNSKSIGMLLECYMIEILLVIPI